MQWSVITPDGKTKEGPYKAQVDRIVGQFIYVDNHRFHFVDDRYVHIAGTWVIKEGDEEIFIVFG